MARSLVRRQPLLHSRPRRRHRPSLSTFPLGATSLWRYIDAPRSDVKFPRRKSAPGGPAGNGKRRIEAVAESQASQIKVREKARRRNQRGTRLPAAGSRLSEKMAGPELLLDSNIRLWVVLPIVIITFFVGMIRHYVSILLQSDKKLTQEQVSDRSAPYPNRPPSLLVTLGKKVQEFCQFT